jgi:Tfp pilus assembly protein PilN
MRAVNLIAEGSGRSGGGSSNAGFALLAVLAVLVAGVAYYVLTDNTVTDRRSQLTTLTTQAAAAQAQADRVRPYVDFASLATARVQTVRQLGAARFDWRHAFAELSKVVPDNVWLTSLLGTVTSGVTVEGAASGATGTLRSALPNPAIELTGCTTTHDNVVRLLSRLRLIDGVVRVSLADSTKGDTSNANSSSGSGPSDSGDCRHGHADFPQFDLVVFFAPLPALPTPSASTPGATTATPAVASGAAPGSAQPAASTTPAPTGAPSTGSAAR